MLALAPIYDVHRWHDNQLSALLDQAINHAGITQVIADAKTNLAPRRIPKLLFGRGQSVFEELNGNTFALAKNDFTVRAYHKSGVVEIVVRQKVFAADDKITTVSAAPVFEGNGHRTV